MSATNQERPIVVFGAGGHGKCVAESLLQLHPDRFLGFVDDDPALAGLERLGRTVIGSLADIARRPEPPLLIVAVGNNDTRRQIVARAVEAGLGFAEAVHPTAVVCAGARLGAGTMLMPHATVCTEAQLGAHVIVNTNASVDHDCRLGDYVHLAPGTHLGGEVTLGEGCFLGIGVSVLPGRTVGPWAVVGAGAVVTRDVEPGATVVGVPAKPLRNGVAE